MTPQEFIAKWQDTTLSERSACQQHFLDICDLLGQPKPADVDKDVSWYTFERGVAKNDGGKGWADVWMRGHFGWEYKGKHKDLDRAYQQLLRYREDLDNPPLLVVCDMDRFEVHTNFTGHGQDRSRLRSDRAGATAEPRRPAEAVYRPAGTQTGRDHRRHHAPGRRRIRPAGRRNAGPGHRTAGSRALSDEASSQTRFSIVIVNS